MEKEQERDEKKKKSVICRDWEGKGQEREQAEARKRWSGKNKKRQKGVVGERGGSKDISQFVLGSQSFFWTCRIMHRPLKIKLLQ